MHMIICAEPALNFISVIFAYYTVLPFESIDFAVEN